MIRSASVTLLQIQEAFTMFDLKQADALPLKDAVRCARALGFPVADESDLRQLVADTKKNGTSASSGGTKEVVSLEHGMVSQDAFVKMIALLAARESTAETTQKGFAALDVLGKGYLDATDLARINASLEQTQSPRHLTDIVRYVDHNQDGKICWRDFSASISAVSANSSTPYEWERAGEREDATRSQRRAAYERENGARTRRTQNAAYFAKLKGVVE